MDEQHQKDKVRLYKQTGNRARDGVWPSDLAEYYDRIDAERGFPKVKLIQGYGYKHAKEKRR